MNIFILEPITDTLAASVIKDVHKADGEDIDVHIMSYGGSVISGNAISSALTNSKSKVTTNVIGVAASMGAVISQAGDERYIAPDAAFNVHNAGMSGLKGRGTKEDHKETIEILEKMDSGMIKAFSKTGLSDSDLKTIMRSDKLLTADEAITLGFFDGLSKSAQAVAEYNQNVKGMTKLSDFMAQVETAAIKMGLKSTDDKAKKALVESLEKELKGQVEEQVIEKEAAVETGADILTSEMVGREEFEMFKAEVLALVKPLLGAVETLPSPEETQVAVEEEVVTAMDSLLATIKSKTVAPNGKQVFEQPEVKKPEDWSGYQAKKDEIKENTGR